MFVPVHSESDDDIDSIQDPSQSKTNHIINQLNVDCAIPPELECPVCLKLFVAPVTTSCGHTFCQTCHGNVIQRHLTCPLCRSYLARSGRKINVALHGLIERTYPDLLKRRQLEIECTTCYAIFNYLENESIHELPAPDIGDLPQRDERFLIPVFEIGMFDSTIPIPLFPESVISMLVYGDLLCNAFELSADESSYIGISFGEGLGVAVQTTEFTSTQILNHHSNELSPSARITIIVKFRWRLDNESTVLLREPPVSLVSSTPDLEFVYPSIYLRNGINPQHEEDEQQPIQTLQSYVRYVCPIYDSLPEFINQHTSQRTTNYLSNGIQESTNPHTDPLELQDYIETCRNELLLLSQEVNRQIGLAGSSGEAYFLLKYGSIPNPQAGLTTKQLEAQSFFFCRITDAPQDIQFQWFTSTKTFERCSQIRQFLTVTGAIYPAIKLGATWERRTNNIVNATFPCLIVLAIALLLAKIFGTTTSKYFSR